MKNFMDENFLLDNETAFYLYYEHAREMPIFDYHCHISPREIWEDKNFKNIAEAWLSGDHYKWRAMRMDGVDEKYITGEADDYEKFQAWAQTLARSIGNPLYHWTHLELQRYFNITATLDGDSAAKIWEQANRIISGGDLSVRKIIEKSNVKVICTTDDPADDLKYHRLIRESGEMSTRVLPTFRPDKAVEIGRKGFREWLLKLSEAADQEISSYGDLLAALEKRVEFFHSEGCRISDHALDTIPFKPADSEQVAMIFQKAMAGDSLQQMEIEMYRTSTFLYLAKLYTRKNWTMQIHTGAMRNNNSRMFTKTGPDSGFDSAHDAPVAHQLSRLLDTLDQEQQLPRTILYNLNPADNYILATMMGNFSASGIGSKIQFGSGWWFNDHKEGMLDQLKTYANVGILSRFIGMLTDSRSFLSYTRHEYFRRILCSLIGSWVENGEYPAKKEYLGQIVRDISYNNAEKYFSV